jgi:dephospho-CoA kinase
MLRVGLTGGIGSGKSTVSALLAREGAVVIDYDQLAREVVEPGEQALEQIAARFGTIASDGTLDRPGLASVVFADDQARKDLEAITHPQIQRRATEREHAAAERAIVVHDNPLLFEMGAAELCDVVVVVDVPHDVQIDRLVRQRGMSRTDAEARIAAQTSRDARLTHADIVIENTGTTDELASRVEDAWDELVTKEATVWGLRQH